MKKIVLLLLLINSLLSANIAIVKKMTGKVELKRNNHITSLQVGSLLENGDIIMSKADSSVGIVFDDGSLLSLGEEVVFVIKNFKFKPSAKEYDIDLKLIKGRAVFNSGKVGKLAPESVKFQIPEGIVGIRGTRFAVEVK